MQNSKIEWTHHTFNPWWGCVKVSPGCEHCYAESFSKRTGHNIWGPAKTTTRRLFGDKHWNEPIKWDAIAKAAGERHRVFCASMADVFEDHPLLVAERDYLFTIIELTPNLDWLLLTKRPENVNGMVADLRGDCYWIERDNIWIGTSVENQEQADKRIPHLLNIPAPIHFLSMEPLLGPIRLGNDYSSWVSCNGKQINGECCERYAVRGEHFHGIDWVIVGGESGHHARPMHPDWARSLRDHCQAAGVPFHFKQWGEWVLKGSIDAPRTDFGVITPSGSWMPKTTGWNGRDIDPDTREAYMVKVGKKAAGRLLDGREWNEYPQARRELQRA